MQILFSMLFLSHFIIVVFATCLSSIIPFHANYLTINSYDIALANSNLNQPNSLANNSSISTNENDLGTGVFYVNNRPEFISDLIKNNNVNVQDSGEIRTIKPSVSLNDDRRKITTKILVKNISYSDSLELEKKSLKGAWVPESMLGFSDLISVGCNNNSPCVDTCVNPGCVCITGICK